MPFDGATKTRYSATMPQLILASQSPDRKILLGQLGVTFIVQPAHVDETPLKNEAPLAYVKRIASAKAMAIAAANPGAVVLAADTPVIVGRRILQTPSTREEAEKMVRLFAGRRVAIPTTLALVDASGKLHLKVTDSWVKVKPLTDAEINAYLTSQHWKCGGALKIEHIGSWVVTLHGSPSGITGLPLYETSILLARAGIKVKPFA